MLNEASPLHVLQVAASYLPRTGGVETHVYEVGRRLVRAGIKVTVLTTDVSGQLPTTEESEGIQIHRVRAWPTNKDYFFAPGIYRFITRGQWDLIHCQGYHNLVPPLAMFAALQANIPFVLSFHSGGDVSLLRKALRGLHWKMLHPLLSHAQKLIAVSQFEADFFQKRLGLPGERFAVIPNGAELSVVTESLRDSISETGDAPLIISVGRLERYKGHHRVIEALPKVLKQVPNARLRIVGAGPYKPTLQKIAKKLDVAKYVEIREVQDRSGMASLLTRANLVTLLSEYESQGIAVMEALALRRPVLVAGTSALQEFVNRDLAYAVPIESTAEEVASAVVSQLREPLIPANIELPTWDACANGLLALYQTVLGRVSCVS